MSEEKKTNTPEEMSRTELDQAALDEAMSDVEPENVPEAEDNMEFADVNDEEWGLPDELNSEPASDSADDAEARQEDQTGKDEDTETKKDRWCLYPNHRPMKKQEKKIDYCSVLCIVATCAIAFILAFYIVAAFRKIGSGAKNDKNYVVNVQLDADSVQQLREALSPGLVYERSYIGDIDPNNYSIRDFEEDFEEGLDNDFTEDEAEDDEVEDDEAEDEEDVPVSDAAVIGIECMDTNEETSSLGAPEGVYVCSVPENSAAFVAGLHTGDVITGINGNEIKDVESLKNFLAEKEPGESVMVSFSRCQGNTYYAMTLPVVLGR